MDASFESLAVGSMFKFFRGGSILKKTSERECYAPQWGHVVPVSNTTQSVIFIPRHESQQAKLLLRQYSHHFSGACLSEAWAIPWVEMGMNVDWIAAYSGGAEL